MEDQKVSIEKSTEELIEKAPETVPVLSNNNNKKKSWASQKQFEQMVSAYKMRAQRSRNMMKAELKNIKSSLGRETYVALKEMMTVRNPEQKNETGEVTQKATETVNWKSLIVEGRNLITALRAERTKHSERKATSGRRSDRVRHNALARSLLKRNEVSKKEPVKKYHKVK
jgi:hypothetical protein